jgi:YidC/Oxa1 family membrane protein insertase
LIFPVIYPPPPPVEKPAETSASALTTVTEDSLTFADPATVEAGAGTEPSDSLPPAREAVVETPEYRAVLSEDGARLMELTLKKYPARRLGPDEPARPQRLIGRGSPGVDQESGALGLRLVAEDGNYLDLSSLRFAVDRTKLEVGPNESGELTFVGRTARGLIVERVFTFTSGDYVIGQKVELRNEAPVGYGGRLTITLSAAPFGGKRGRYDNVAGLLDGSLLTDDAEDVGKELAKRNGRLISADWLGYMDQYFLTAFILSGGEATNALQAPSELSLSSFPAPGDGARLTASWPLRLASGAQSAYDFSVYAGPKDSEALTKAGHGLSRSVDLGWFSFLALPLARLLRLFHSLTGNYGAAIIIVTLLIKVALWPLTAKSYKSMKAMQKLQPRIQALRERLKDDREAMNREMMQLYRTYKVNPMGGCLPMLLQIPFFIAFYRALDYALELRGAPFCLWITDLSAPDRLFNFDFTVPFLEPPTGVPVMTLLMAASMVWQQKMTPTMGDPTQAKMMMLMPIIFSVILLNMPSGLVLYWLVNNVLSIFQQKLINRPAASADHPAS